jgi:hypothetical protein
VVEQSTGIVQRFEENLLALDRALTEASAAVSALRLQVPQMNQLAEMVATIESAIESARRAAGTPEHIPPAAVIAPLEPVPAASPPTSVYETEPATSSTPSEQADCFRVQVHRLSGSLDLKAVDAVINEKREIVDVALLDYDGRQATLKVWVSGTRDLESLRKAIGSALIERLGGAAEAAVTIEPERLAAA